MKKPDIYSQLNKEQLDAVKYSKGPLLVLAGAGSGKTRILTTRIVHMIKQGMLPWQILAVTFTNKAASEMRERVEKVVDTGVSIGTFHSICLRILRRHASKIGFKGDFSIYDDQDQLSIIKECMKELNIDVKVVNPKGIREKISRCKDSLLSALSSEVVDYDNHLFSSIYQKYTQKLLQYNGLDFGDLIFQTVNLFENNPKVLVEYQNRYKHILVDEYQDTNAAQYAFIKLLAQKNRNITVVGDPDQSIYEWRGASIENILRFEKDFKHSTIIRLEQNYRSTNNILNAANAVISNNMNRKDKNLWSDKGDGDKINLYKAGGERTEARYLVEKILRLVNSGYTLNQLVGFYRTHSQSRVLEEELMRNNIPYKIVGGLKFYARKEIKDMLAFLKVVHNSNDEVSLTRIINVPKKGIGKSLISKIRIFAHEQGCSFYEAISAYVKSLKKLSKGAKSLLEFVDMIERLRGTAVNARITDLVEAVIDETGYVEMLENENTVEAKSRLENINEFLGAISEFQETLKWKDVESELQAYLEFISLQSDIDNFYEQDQSFTLMTLHGAKGLEFPVVFMLGMEEGLLPHSNSLNGSEKELEEERRLCYVGFTRAMDKLYLSYATTRKIFGLERRQIPSRFLYEMPAEVMNKSIHDFENRLTDHRNDPFHSDYVEKIRYY